MARYWISDLHLGHRKVAEIRGFATIEEHDEAVLAPLRALRPGDHVWVLGDLSSSRPSEQQAALAALAQIPAELHLIAGNHDAVSSANRDGYKHQRAYLEVFESVQQFGRIAIAGQQVLMSHYPYARSGDGPGRGEGRHLEYRLPDQGRYLIHGHTHHTEPHMTRTQRVYGPPGASPMWEEREVPDLQQFCVSWDAHRGLVTEKTITDWVASA